MNFFSLFKRNLIFKFKKKIDIDKDIFPKDIDLDKLFYFYKTDKSNYLNENNKYGHGYSEFYEKHLSKFKDKNLNILEIGSYSGASASAFVKYFNKAKVYCLDINLSKFKFKSKKIYPFGLDANNKKMIYNFFKKINFFNTIKKFDIIIDDGSHILSDQLKSLNFFFHHVMNGGFYIIEDYRFPEYFSHLKDVDDGTINELIENLKNEKNENFKLLNKETFDILKKNILNIHKHKGKTEHSDIVFIEKLN